MIVGLILVATVLGAAAALGAVLLGQSIWIALLIYSGTGVLAVLVLATIMALRTDPKDRAEPAEAYPLAGPQRG
ncbi:hypothetical protein [Roseovarius autotrophicus]|uniref:hypothetical protein n=1 Tax=Roseovarius autotrophicus TaxID=2824121 RepID=UPI0019F18A25|nr:hypothetical protein [Roseovarius autotrophicus]MBE0454269.1 hypothetical protein [Roseovarius sp.]